MNTYSFSAGDRHIEISAPSLLDLLCSSPPSLFCPDLEGTQGRIYSATASYEPKKKGSAAVQIISPDLPSYMPCTAYNCYISGLQKRELPSTGAILPWETPLGTEFDPFQGPLDVGRAWGLFYGLTGELLYLAQRPKGGARGKPSMPAQMVDVYWLAGHCYDPLAYIKQMVAELKTYKYPVTEHVKQITARLQELAPYLPRSGHDLVENDSQGKWQTVAHQTVIYFYRRHQYPAFSRYIRRSLTMRITAKERDQLDMERIMANLTTPAAFSDKEVAKILAITGAPVPMRFIRCQGHDLMAYKRIIRP